MRFIENGPKIPDELLFDLDEGKVVFFCGAGVSIAKAKLPSFFELTELVMKSLGASTDCPAAKLREEAYMIEANTGVSGIISADRIFGLLERDFSKQNIEAAVTKTLKPCMGVDLTAHELLLRLATSKDGCTKLVTTNFDRLFDDCSTCIDTWLQPRLPNPDLGDDFNGIVYLHGRATKKYDGAEGGGFVLSSSDFGRAYLSESWATNFIKNIIDLYTVVFVGYSADDPPVQYLLEALNKSFGNPNNTYAFQSGSHEDASMRWKHKGVRAIPYSCKDDHNALWSTFSAWSKRAQDPEAWQDSIVNLALNGPEQLKPFQREQVTHLVSSKEGAQKFSNNEIPPPSTWLCVFDPKVRFGKPGEIGAGKDEGKNVAPFDLYGLDIDPAPDLVGQDDNNVWSAFELNQRDKNDLRDEQTASLIGNNYSNLGDLPDRIMHLGHWLINTSEQNAAVWWAARQHGLHPRIQEKILPKLVQSGSKFAIHIYQAWEYLFEHWRTNSNPFWHDKINLLAEETNIFGWNNTTVRKFKTLFQPRILVNHNNCYGPIPPQKDEVTNLNHLISPSVVIDEYSTQIKIPDEFLGDVVAACKRNLDKAIQLMTELGIIWKLNHLPPIIPSNDPDIDEKQRKKGIPGAFLYYANLFEHLLIHDPERAKQEATTWPIDDYLYARLRIWSCGFDHLVPNESFEKFLKMLVAKHFGSLSISVIY